MDKFFKVSFNEKLQVLEMKEIEAKDIYITELEALTQRVSNLETLMRFK